MLAAAFAAFLTTPRDRLNIIAAVAAFQASLLATSLLAGLAWAYYQQKLAWVLASLSASLCIAILGAAAVRSASQRRYLVLLGGAAVACLSLLCLPLVASGSTPGRVASAVGFAHGPHSGGDELFDLVAGLSDDNAVQLLWEHSSPHSQYANFWVLNLHSGRHSPLSDERFAIRTLAYQYAHPTLGWLCQIGTTVAVPVQVLTDQSEIADELVDCGANPPRVLDLNN
jgi:hypothetical protein